MLPRIINRPVHELRLASGPLRFNPPTVGDEKILLTAKESDDETEILRAIRQIVQNRCVDEGFDANRMPIADLEWVFVQLYALGSGGTTTVAYVDATDGKTREFKIDLTAIPPPATTDPGPIGIAGGMTVRLGPPLGTFYDRVRAGSIVDAVAASIRSVTDADGTEYAAGDDWDERVSFVDGIDSGSFTALAEAVSRFGTLSHSIVYTNDEGTERLIVLRTVSDFFTLR